MTPAIAITAAMTAAVTTAVIIVVIAVIITVFSIYSDIISSNISIINSVTFATAAGMAGTRTAGNPPPLLLLNALQLSGATVGVYHW